MKWCGPPVLPLLLGVVAVGGAFGVTTALRSGDRAQLDRSARDPATNVAIADDAQWEAARRELLAPPAHAGAAAPAREPSPETLESFADVARARLVAKAPLAEKAAWLLKARAVSPTLYDELCAMVLAGGEQVDTRLRETIVSRFNEEAPQSSRTAQRSIDQVVFESTLPLYLRLGAARTLFEQAEAPLLDELVPRVAPLADASLRDAILAALDENPSAAAGPARQQLIRAHGWTAKATADTNE